MRPGRPGSTRTAQARPPDHYPARGRYPGYLAFGACGFFLMSLALLVLRAVWVLGSRDAAAWDALLSDLAHPVYLAYHGVALVAMLWFALRIFSRVPATQPPRLGPFRRPPDRALVAGLNGVFLLVSLAAVLLLWGLLP
jgi:fumarate reductase subunit C